MKVGILTSFYPEIQGGAEASLAALLDGFRRFSLEPIVLTFSRPQLDKDGCTISVAHFRALPKIVRLSGFPGLNSILARAVSKTLREHSIDILHVNDTYSLRAAARATKDLNIPLVLSFHNNLKISYASYSVPFPVSSWLDFREKGVLEAARKCSVVIATSDYVAQRLVEAGLSPASVKSIHIGGAICVSETHPARLDHPNVRLLSVGRMQYHKGFQNVILAVKKLSGDGVPVDVIMAGDGRYRSSLVSLAIQLGVTDRVKFTGWVSSQDLRFLYDWCDVVVVPTISPEPFGRVAVEAMSRGRPVIGTNAGGLTEIIDNGKTGFLVPPNDPSAIAEAVLPFRDQPRLLEEMGAWALGKCRAAFDQTMIAGQVLEVYRSLAPP